MKPPRRQTVIGIVLGVALSLIIYLVFGRSPFALAIGCVAGVYYSRPATLLQGALTGAIIALPLGILISAVAWLTPVTPAAPRVGPLAALEDIALILVFGAVYGLVFVWLTKRMTRGQNVS
jgi:hypothetical protein